MEMDENRRRVSMVHASRAEWAGRAWNYFDPLLSAWDKDFWRPISGIAAALHAEKYREEPETFMRSSVSAADLNARDAALLIKDLRQAGLPTAQALTDYHHRFSFSAVSFVVIFLSLTVAGRFKKNILLLSLLASLGTAVIFYVVEMLSMMSARFGLLPPFWGAWLPVFVCTAAGFFLLRQGKA
jgi:lipopolysaccharide export system permease protein